MAEYINRDDLLKAAWDKPTLSLSVYDIGNIKPVDVAPVRHARWEDKPNPQWRAYDIRYCSACGWSIHKSKLRNADLNWEYCPSCGAKMDLEG